jgi:Dyp-type peroxidase family
MAVVLDLADIQGNILAGYGKLGYPTGRNILFHIDGENSEDKARNGRLFVTEILPLITTALRWSKPGVKATPGEVLVPQPEVAVNIAFTFSGLVALGISTRTLRGMPDEFIDGMAKRASMLGDDFTGKDFFQQWDEVWQPSSQNGASVFDVKAPHILIMLNKRWDVDAAVLGAVSKKLESIAFAHNVRVLEGHNQRGGAKRRYQELSAIFKADASGRSIPLDKEHFGFSDGISDPTFEGQYLHQVEQLEATGNGAIDGHGKWRPIATGEFLLGYPDEAQETPGAAMPLSFSRNGTFMAYRKLHQRVASWRTFVRTQAEKFGKVFGVDDPDDAYELLVAKMAGRWSDGVPLSKASDAEAWRAFNKQYPVGSPERRKALIDFTFGDDPAGAKCPATSHVRRVNTRDALDPWVAVNQPERASGSVLNNRRRILRRGLPYGSSPEGTRDDDDHGIVMLIVCASLGRQFEFVQQQWVNYGLDARAGNDTCPLVGNHSQGALTKDPEARRKNGPPAKYVIPADPNKGHPPYVSDNLPQFIETRGGEYFFVPSLTALRMIGMGTVDPT